MSRPTLPFAALVAALFSCALGSCVAPEVYVQATYGELTPDGDVALSDTAGITNVSNSVEDLGVDDDESAVGARVDLKWGAPHLTIATQSSSWSGDGVLTATFGGLPADTAVDTDLDLGLHRAVLTFDVVPTDLVEVGLGFGVTLIDFDATVTEREALIPGTQRESADEILPVPVLAARVGARLWRFDLEALVAGMQVDLDGDDVTYVEVDLNGRLALFGSHGGINGSLVGGWRSIELEADYEDGGERIEADLSFDGPYIGLQIGI